MARCRECRTYNMKISATSSRRTFVFQCVNPRCRATYVRTLGITDDLAAVSRDIAAKRALTLGFLQAARHGSDGSDSE